VALSQIPEKVKIFFSFAPDAQDQNLFDNLRKHLAALKRQGLIDMFYDSMIIAGGNADHIIEAYIRTADIIVLLMSADFFDSDQCCDVEMRCALEQHATRDAYVIPVLLRPTEWEGFSLERYPLLPPDGKAVTDWHNLDQALKEVAKGIRRIVETFAHKLTSGFVPVQQPQSPLYLVPHRRNPFFTDRVETLTALHTYFAAGPSHQTRTQALYGLGGMGKTLLAIEYSSRYQHEYQAVLWLHSTPRELFQNDLLTLTAQLGIPIDELTDEQERLKALKRWLQQHERWLLVLDKLDDFSSIDQFVPTHSNGHVLVITQSQATGAFAHAVSVTQMTSDEGALLLLRRARLIPEQGSRDATSAEQYHQALAIAQELDGYPLALDQAGAYIEETHRDLTSYLELYQKRRTELLGRRGRLAHDHPNPVTTTLSLTFDKLAHSDPNALELLRLFAFLQPDALPNEMIAYGASTLHGSLHKLATDSIALDNAIATLNSFSLVYYDADTTMLHIPRIVQTLLTAPLTLKQKRQWASQVVRLVNLVFPEVSFDSWTTCERYQPQAQHCSVLIHDLQLTLKEAGLLLERLGSYCYQRGCYTDAETYLTQALHLHEQQTQQDTPHIAQTLNSLGRLSQRLGHYPEAEKYHQRALTLREAMPEPDEDDVTESLHNLAVCYENQGHYALAEQFYLRVLSLDERTREANDPETAKTLNNLGLVYYLQGNYTQAETAYQRALAIYERAFSTKHPDITYTLNSLGTLYEKRGDYAQAESLYQQALTIREQTFGADHTETAHSINKLADIYELQGRDQEAEALYKRTLSIFERELGNNHPDVALSLNNLAFLATKQEHYQPAELFYQRALNIYEQTLEAGHPDIASVLHNLGRLFLATKDLKRADTFLRQALAMRTQALGPTHPDTAQSLNALADLLIEQKAQEEALSLSIDPTQEEDR
jgi:tetratricopeptide (TPR) repeat protein